MLENSEDFFEDMEMDSSVNRYESMTKKGEFAYFDVDEIEEIVNFYVENNRLDKAGEACSSGLLIHPASSELKLKSAQIYISRGKWKDALLWLDKCKELSRWNYEYLLTEGVTVAMSGNIEKATKIFNKALVLIPENEIDEAIFTIADTFENNGGNINTAIYFLQKGLDKKPDNKDFYFRLAINYERIGDYKKSLSYYHKYLDFDAFSASGWFNLGLAYNRAEQYEKAVEAYDYVLALENNHYDALFNKANALANAEKYHEAIKIYREYLDIFDDSLIAQYYIGECHFQIKEFNKALEIFDEILKKDDAFTEAIYGKAMVLGEQNRYFEAVELYRKALNIDSEDPDIWFSLGSLHFKNSNYTAAAETLKEVVALNNYDIEAWLLYAETTDKLNNIDESISILLQAVDFMPTNIEIIYALSAFYFKLGDTTTAMHWFKTGYTVDKKASKLVFKIYPEVENIKELQEFISQNN